MTRPGNHQALRAATAACHSRLDQLFGRFDLSDASGYGRFLRAHATVVPMLETALGQAGLDRLLPDWPLRHRSQLLLADLAELGLDAPAVTIALPLAADGSVWGAAYVLEGSRLGGSVLSRRLPTDAPKRYLGAVQPPSAWPEFLKRLDAGLDLPAALSVAIDTAQLVFALFETAGQREMERMISV